MINTEIQSSELQWEKLLSSYRIGKNSAGQLEIVLFEIYKLHIMLEMKRIPVHIKLDIIGMGIIRNNKKWK